MLGRAARRLLGTRSVDEGGGELRQVDSGHEVRHQGSARFGKPRDRARRDFRNALRRSVRRPAHRQELPHHGHRHPEDPGRQDGPVLSPRKLAQRAGPATRKAVTTRIPGSEWRAFVRKNGTPEFAAAFTPAVSLDTAVMNGPLSGVDLVGAFFAATTKMYDHLDFTHEIVVGGKTYMEWQGEAFGSPIAGTTIVTRNEAGLIESIRLYHRPLSAVLRFSAELAKRLGGSVDAAMFAKERAL